MNNDGKVNALDALIIIKISAGLISPTPLQISAGDVNNDGAINSRDGIIILQMVVGNRSPEKFHRSSEITISGIVNVDSETLILPFNINNPPILAGGDIVIKYDDNALQFLNLSSEDKLLLSCNANDSGTIRISFSTLRPFVNNELFRLKFHILNPNTSFPEIKSINLFNFDAFPIKCTIAGTNMRPKSNRLFQNFPNPFNPETWIPYQLKEDCEVNITIYRSSGEVVRELRLGSKSAGVYTSKDKAVYWDGKDETGIPVASGVYFYCIKAGDFTDTRKMIILK